MKSEARIPHVGKHAVFEVALIHHGGREKNAVAAHE